MNERIDIQSQTKLHFRLKIKLPKNLKSEVIAEEEKKLKGVISYVASSNKVKLILYFI